MRQQGVNYLSTTIKPPAKFFISYLHDYIRYSGRRNVDVDNSPIVYLSVVTFISYLHDYIRFSGRWNVDVDKLISFMYMIT